MVRSGVLSTSLRRAGMVLLFLAGCAEPQRPPPEAPALHERPTDSATLVEARYFTVSIGESVADAEERANMLSALARQPGSNFGEISRQYTGAAPQTVRFERGSVPTDQEALAEATFGLAVGEVSRPVRVGTSFAVVHREANPAEGPTSVGAKHILIMHVDSKRVPDGVTRTREEAQALAADIARRARAGENWEELHRTNTDEPGSPTGGDLGTFERGSMVPAFEAAVWGMEVGAISDPIETPFGFHVIQRTR